jgi:cyclin A
MKLQVVHEKIAHKKLSIEQIKKKESEILQAIQFNLIGATPFEITAHILLRCNLKDILEPRVFNYLEKICVYLA